jgi:DNA-binding transcriptional regulator LsrR (DeoR family)
VSSQAAPTATREDDALAGQVARLFYDRQLTKVEIASRLGISRFRVARLLDRALVDGLVRIEFRDAPDEERGLARAIEERFGIDLCVVAAGADGVGEAARLAAGVLDGLIGAGAGIGIAWGSTVARVVRELPVRMDPSIDVVQLAGGSSALDPAADPGDLTRVLAERLGGRAHRIHAPAFVESAELRDALLRQPEIAATAARFDDLDVALLGIGAFASGDPAAGSSSLLRSGALDAADVRRLAADGALGDLLVHPFDAEGRFVGAHIARRAVAIGVDQLRRIPRVLAVAAGADKAEAIGGALRTGVIRILVTDAAAAAGVVRSGNGSFPTRRKARPR